MNERELIALKVDALFAADLNARSLEAAGQISLELRDAWLDENRDKRQRLDQRREKLNETQGATTPILTADQAQKLRTAVEKLHAQNMGEAAVRALLQEVLTAAEAAASADEATGAPVGSQASASGIRDPKTVAIPSFALSATIVGAIAVGVLIAVNAGKRR